MNVQVSLDENSSETASPTLTNVGGVSMESGRGQIASLYENCKESPHVIVWFVRTLLGGIITLLRPFAGHQFGDFFHNFRVFGGDLVFFAYVLRQIVKFDGSVRLVPKR